MLNITLNALLKEKAENCSDSIAIIFENEKVTYKEFYESVQVVSKAMLQLGVNQNDKIGIVGKNSLKWLYVFFAALNIGAIPVPINSEYGTEEIQEIINETTPKLVFANQNYKKNNILKKLEYINKQNKFEIIILDESLYNQKTVINWNDFLNTPKDGIDVSTYCQYSQELFCIQYTSGSTGKPKGVLLSQFSVMNNGKHTGDALHLDSSDKLCLAVPLFHCFGNVLALLSCITHGTPIVMVDYFSPQKVLDTLEKYNCTVFFGVPTMYIKIMEMPTFKNYKLTKLVKGVVAGALVTKELMKKISSQLSIPYLISGYGLTETSPGCMIADIFLDENIRFSTVGAPFPNVDIRLIGVNNKEVNDLETGEVLVKGYNVMKGYYGDKVVSNIIDEEGWLHTGDLAYRNNGYYTIIGRKDDVIIKGGENISPIEIENILCSFDKIIDAKVFGIPNDTYGEQVAVAIICKEKMFPEDIVSFLKYRIADFKLPSYVFFFSEFPCSASGKVLKKKIKEMAIRQIECEGKSIYEI